MWVTSRRCWQLSRSRNLTSGGNSAAVRSIIRVRRLICPKPRCPLELSEVSPMSDDREPCIRCRRQIELLADGLYDWQPVDDGLVCAACLTFEERWAVDQAGFDTASCRCPRCDEAHSPMPIPLFSMPTAVGRRAVKPVWTGRRFTRGPRPSSTRPLSILSPSLGGLAHAGLLGITRPDS
jgi:hypothetical protein